MTREEAIKILKEHYDFMQRKELEIAIADMEKQIPKKILYREQSYGTPWLCAECEADQIKVEFFREDGYEPKEMISFCWHCGQALSWTEEGE